MARLVIVSNRVSLPGERISRAGGLAVGLREALRKHGGVWFGWSGVVSEEPPAAPKIVEAGKTVFATVDLTRKDHDEYYSGYANSSLWPLFHYRVGLIEFRRAAFEGYQRVNAMMARMLKPLLNPDDLVWVHDYHLIPFAAELRKLGVANRVGFFLHTPFPPAQVLVALPAHEALMEAMCSFDLVGFQTANDVRAFSDYIVHDANGRFLADGTFTAFGRTARAAAFPIGIDADQFTTLAREAANANETTRLKSSLVGRDLIIGVDRLDYSKGLPNRFEAFERMLERWPEHRAKVTFLQIAPPSRSDVAQYRALRRQLESAAGRINGKYAEFDWQPIRYLNKSFARGQLAGFLRIGRVGLITPLRDGMNLVAKEYVAAQNPENPGVLVLSRFAGAARELDTALIVNPYDIEDIAEALHHALVMPLVERIERWRAMDRVVRRNTISTWREGFIATLSALPAAA
ncbi:MAG TPA: alpha,alpha-trehalose-phosphate synthase (UDP-forming) [Alphaproteobacteria bacterium]|nr:alpha,alpha-trehalose-phosphate synthase (UDP-forming) [Alphaproteobacteria bacterium]